MYLKLPGRTGRVLDGTAWTCCHDARDPRSKQGGKEEGESDG